MSIIEWSTTFSTTVVCDTDLLPNIYDVTIGLSPCSMDLYEQNIGFERVKFLFNSVCSNSCLIGIMNPLYGKLTKLMTNTQFITTPGEPYDQMIIVLLYHKLNAVLENKFECDYIHLASFQGENVKYHFDSEYTADFVDEKTYFPAKIKEKRLPWWLRSDPSVWDTLSKTPNDLIYDWEDIGLSFDNPEEEKAGEVIDITSYNKTPKKIFNPRVIDGTKHIDPPD